MVEIQIHKFVTWGRNKIFILREDLLPVACGGNKSRIGLKLIEDAKRRKEEEELKKVLSL